MFETIIKHRSYILILALWSIAGMLNTAIATVVILTTLILFFQKERYYEALFGFFFLLVISDNLEDLFSFAKVVKPLYLILMGVLCFVDKRFVIYNYGVVKRFIPFLLIALISTIYSVDVSVSLQKIVSYSLLLFVIPNIVLYEYEKHGSILFVNLVAFSFIIHMISISILITFPEVGISHGGRWSGVFGNPNGLGIYLIVNYILYRTVSTKYPHHFTVNDRRVYLLLTLFFTWMSGSRNALFSIFIFELINVGFQYSKALTFVLMITFIGFSDYFFEGLISFLEYMGFGKSLRLSNIEEGSGRVIAWMFTWEEINRNSMVLGRGLGYDEYYMRSNFDLLSRLGHEGGVHNTYLILWINTGIMGLLAFFTAVVSFIVESYKRNKFAFSSLVAVLISINYEPWLSGSLNPYTSIFIVLLVLFVYIDNDEIQGVV